MVGNGLGVEVGFDVILEHGEGEFHGEFEGLGELGKESEVVVEEVAQVIDAVSHHRDPFDTEAECESAKFSGVDAVPFEDIGVDESSPAELDPLAVEKLGSGDRVIDAGFDEGEEVGSEADIDFGAEHGAGKFSEGAFEVGHGDAPINHEAVHLVECVVVGAINGFVAEGAADSEDSEGGLLSFEDSALEGGALGTEN